MLRVSEIINLEYNDLDFQNRLIFVRNKNMFTVKGSRPRTIPMNTFVYSMLLNKERKSNFVFTNNDGKQLNPRSVSRKFKKYARASQLSEDIHFHTLRHSGASWLIQASVPIYDVQKILGHSSPTVTQIYAHQCDDNLRKSIEKLSDESADHLLI